MRVEARVDSLFPLPRRPGIAELVQQRLQLVAAPVHVADEVERTAFVPLVRPERVALYLNGFDLFRRGEHVHVAKALALQPLERALELPGLVAHHVRTEVALGARRVARQAERLGQVEDDSRREAVIGTGELQQGGAVFAAHAGGVDDGQAPVLEPFRRDVAHQLEGVFRDGEVVLVVANGGAASV